MSKEEAVKYLRAADNEVIQIGKQISATLAFESMMALVGYDKSPIPSVFSNRANKNNQDQQYIFADHLGIYRFNQPTGEFLKISPSDSVIVMFPYKSPYDSLATFILANYEEEPSLLQTVMPTLIDAKMSINGINVMAIMYRGEMNHGIPVRGEMETTMGRFFLNFSQKTRLSKDHGKMKAVLTISTEAKDVLEVNINAEILLSNSGELTFNEITTRCNIFPVEILAKIEYGRIDPWSGNFINEFNHYSSVEVFSREKHQKIGDILLSERENSDKLNLMIRYKDGSLEYLEDLLLFVNGIFNVKKN